MNWLVKKYNMVCTTLEYNKHFLVLGSIITGCVSVSVFSSSVGIPVGITSFEVGLKICVIIAVIKKYKSIIQKKRKNHEKIVL